jgi:cytochrome o ubiquinol oxidase subunit 2
MSSKTKLWAAGGLLLAVIVLAGFRLHSASIPVLESRGVIGHKERNLILAALGLCMIVVIPVYVMLISFAWKYRAGNKQARYEPNFDHSRLLESLWWGIPFVIISILAVITWHSSNDLDPFKSLSSGRPPITIQVISLQWKWLFIYPQQNVASVNFVQFPVNTPVDFEITSDAPMNSLWIPQLGGQIYAMSGMSTHLHLMADKAGDYYGSSANISGDGFAGMNFTARAGSETDFNNWLAKVRQSPDQLSQSNYDKLSRPTQNSPVSYYASAASGLYSGIVNKFITPPNFTAVEVQ